MEDAAARAAADAERAERQASLEEKARLRAIRKAAPVPDSVPVGAGARVSAPQEEKVERSWVTRWHPRAEAQLRKLPDDVSQAILAHVRMVETFELDFSFRSRLARPVATVPGLYELRPRQAAALHRPVFILKDRILWILAIAPDGEEDKKGFAAVCESAMKLAG